MTLGEMAKSFERRCFVSLETPEFQEAIIRASNQAVRQLNVELDKSVSEFSTSPDVLDTILDYDDNELNYFQLEVARQLRFENYTTDDDRYIDGMLRSAKAKALIPTS